MVLVIDCREERGKKLEECVRACGHKAVTYGLGMDVPGELRPELLLLHIGDAQVDQGDDIAQTIGRFGDCLILCYRGGIASWPAENCPMVNVALFPPLVPMDEPGEDLLRTVRQVLAQWAQREHLGREWFRSIVTGFDPVLEAKLEVLIAALKGAKLPEERLMLIRSKCPRAFTEDGRLACDGTPQSVARLRKIFFNEDPWEHSA